MAFQSRGAARPILNATRARSGRMGVHVFWVLVFSTLLAILAMFAAWTWTTGDLAAVKPRLNQQAADAPAFHAPQPAAVVNQPATAQPPPGT